MSSVPRLLLSSVELSVLEFVDLLVLPVFVSLPKVCAVLLPVVLFVDSLLLLLEQQRLIHVEKWQKT